MNIHKDSGTEQACELLKSSNSNNTNMVFILLLIAMSMMLRLLFMSTADLLAEEAYYWNYARHLDFGYLDHPPMVALLIKLSTTLLGNTEFAVRFLTLFCTGVSIYFSVRLSELICKGTGLYVVLLFAILPFFFMYSLVITPDVPLLSCWSASLYYLYQAMCLNKARAWYAVGIAFGLGMLSKYSICLLFLATFIYLLKNQRSTFFRKEPYIAACLTIAIFTPVIYWNATHDWASFAFQSTRRLQASPEFSLHALIGLFLLFLTPVGVYGFGRLFKPSAQHTVLDASTIFFMKVYTLVPIAVFAFFSVRHEIKFNWIGPSLLACIPWLALLIKLQKNNVKPWVFTAMIALSAYAGLVSSVSFSPIHWVNRALLNKYIAWGELTRQLYGVAQKIDSSGHKPIFIALDSYSIASELAYYQLKQGVYPRYAVMGAERFGYQSLMYHYWSHDKNLAGKYAILIAALPNMFQNGNITRDATVVVPPKLVWAHSQGRNKPIRQFYYEVVRFNEKITPRYD